MREEDYEELIRLLKQRETEFKPTVWPVQKTRLIKDGFSPPKGDPAERPGETDRIFLPTDALSQEVEKPSEPTQSD